jgi:hypothetical protein
MVAPKQPGFATLLRSELRSAGVFPRSDRFEATRSELVRIGRSERQSVVNLIGPGTWHRSLHTLQLVAPEDDCARVLGYGYGLTAFLLAPLQNLKDADVIYRLGAQANLIITLYDRNLDLGHRGHLSEAFLQVAARNPMGIMSRLQSAFVPPLSRAILILIYDYFRQLRQFRSESGRTWVYEQIVRAVLKMHQVEHATLVPDAQAVREGTLRRKAALPLVVLGLGGWLVVPEFDAALFRWHLRWLYRCGNLIGWIDDAADLEEDAATGRPNRVERRLGNAMTDDPARYLAAEIAKTTRAVLTDWSSRMLYPKTVPLWTRDAFSTVLLSWLGGATVA